MTRLLGRSILCVQGVECFQSSTAVPGGIPSADGRAGSSRPLALQLPREFGVTVQSITNWVGQAPIDDGKPLPGKAGLTPPSGKNWCGCAGSCVRCRRSAAYWQRLRPGLPVAAMRHPRSRLTRGGESGRPFCANHVPLVGCLGQGVPCLAGPCPFPAKDCQRGDDRANRPRAIQHAAARFIGTPTSPTACRGCGPSSSGKVCASAASAWALRMRQADIQGINLGKRRFHATGPNQPGWQIISTSHRCWHHLLREEVRPQWNAAPLRSKVSSTCQGLHLTHRWCSRMHWATRRLPHRSPLPRQAIQSTLNVSHLTV